MPRCSATEPNVSRYSQILLVMRGRSLEQFGEDAIHRSYPEKTYEEWN